MTLPLINKRVVVTRPRTHAVDLSGKLTALGAEVILLPVIDITPLADYSAPDEALRDMARYDWVIFTSVKGVEAFWSRCLQIGIEPNGLIHKVAAVGPATAAALQSSGISPALVPQRYVAQGLVGELGDVNGQRILLARAEQAPDALPDELRAKGALVDDVPVYRTIPVTPGSDALDELRQGIDIITFASSSAVTSFVELVDLPEFDVLRLPTACLGPITAATARNAGFTTIITAQTYTTDGLVAAISDYYATAYE